MIPQANITAWRANAPWADDAQVEQDLVLTRALIELFSEPELTGRIALRGGTAIHKLFLRPACRYSEDIDLVQTEPGSTVLTIDELAEYLKVSKSTLYKLAQEASIPGQKVGKHWRFHKDAVDEWLRQRGPAAQPPKVDPEI